MCPHDVPRERAASCFLVTPVWRSKRRVVVTPRGCRAARSVVAMVAATRRRALPGHQC
ncbi:hypothetical protein A2U01_0094878 [Trifolium medium]|uniref:Uncharacterized protein n=1 Tax=Trifolium medium TaxID=97028 RepID=A0A392ULU6_9FABA|nr:hypothetical protein [Trifolium medium]